MKDKPRISIRQHATAQASALLRRLAFQANRTAKLTDADAIHDFRVSNRRLTQCLIVFHQFFPGAEAKRVRRKLGALMDLASEVRNRDIALDLLKRAKLPAGSSLAQTLSREREQAERDLREALKRWNRRDAHRKWRARLEL